MSMLLLLVAAPVTAAMTTTTFSTDSISTVSPAAGQRGDTVTVTITGVNFTRIQGDVWLEKSGENNIEADSITSWTEARTIVCKFKISSSRDLGKWNVVVSKGLDSTTIVGVDKFTITEKMTLTSISPVTGRVDKDVDFTLKGKNFDNDLIKKVFLYKKGNTNITDDNVDVKSSTELKGTFDLDDVEEDTYDVCIEDKAGIVECDLEFEVTTNDVGSIDFSSSPSGATIYIDNIANGTTPNTVDDLLVGSYKVVLKKSGYEDWGKNVNVEDGEETKVEAKLYAVATATQATQATPVPPTATRTTVRTVAKSTIKVPTTWVDTPTTTAASPLDPAIIIGAVGLVLIALRKP
jgi:hypothetical protein